MIQEQLGNLLTLSSTDEIQSQKFESRWMEEGVETDYRLADFFNNHFNLIMLHLNMTTDLLQTFIWISFLKTNSQSLNFNEITSAEIKIIFIILRPMKSNNCIGPLDILKLCSDRFVECLIDICNSLVKTGSTPVSLKKLKIISFHQSGSMKDINYYRPISLLSRMDKILRKAVNTRLSKFLN